MSEHVMPLLPILAVAVVSCSSDEPCPPPMLICVADQEEADRKNADMKPGCSAGRYVVCDGGGDSADVSD